MSWDCVTFIEDSSSPISSCRNMQYISMRPKKSRHCTLLSPRKNNNLNTIDNQRSSRIQIT